ncbi:RNA polymerase II C-terminal domain phosphatase-like 1 [Rutidosis leptorrhynchoides]|uniref:RNA polymerase II C-terminal domain phosphatase-like 1 n=1 Tax=Rutidosis leptorrhynchoides TaxID=125765 RepID=UPI003A9989B4
MYKSVVAVYDGEKLLGDVEVYYNPSHMMNSNSLNLRDKLKDKIRISYYSTPSERCSPLAVLHTITTTASSSSSTSGICLKMESVSKTNNLQLNLLHTTCLRENKTAVAPIDGEELHLVAMRSRRSDLLPCFWGFNVAPGLYESCLVMLNLRCLGIVFDLDETLVVANTLRSFEDKIEAIQRKLSSEIDPQRVAGMLSEIKRYQDDRNILKQYAESDQVVDSGKLIKAQSEAVAVPSNHQPLVRPIIRLQEKNIILTRINPLIRDTSVLVRLRPAWEDLRSYLMARGRKRFEVFVCTMAERDYALEMWRLLDPDSNLITTKELLNRIVCVKSGLKKSLFNVFQEGNCHPKIALVIDDRLKVWDERDQPRVHVVPAFAPYYAPQAEANSAVPVLCVARNVACNVRGGFFKDFDDSLLQRINEVGYEDEIKDILPPDVSNYLISEDDASAINGSKESVDAEVERRLKVTIQEAIVSSKTPPVMPKPDPVIKTSFQYSSAPASLPIVPPGSIVQYANKELAPVVEPKTTQVNLSEVSLHSSPAREEGELPESELDPDTRRRLLILQHGMDFRAQKISETTTQFPGIRPPPMPVAAAPPHVEPHAGGWFPNTMGVEEIGPRQLNRITPPTTEFPLHSSDPNPPMQIEKKHPLHALPFVPKVDAPIMPERVLEIQRLPKEVLQRDERLRLSHSPPVYSSFQGEESSLGQSSSSNRDMDIEGGSDDSYAESPAEYLCYVAFKCGTKVEFRQAVVPSVELQFSFEVWFAGERIGEGTGRTRREAQRNAAETSLMNLADKYLSRLKPGEEGRFVSDGNSFGRQPLLREDSMTFSTATVQNKGPIAALNELCMMEGLGMAFQAQPRVSSNMGQNNELYAQVEIDGEVWGKGVGLTWDEAKMQAAATAFMNLKARIGQFPQKRQPSPRSFQGMPAKRFRAEYPRVMQRMPSSARYT